MATKTKREKVIEQIKLQETIIRRANINIVNCCHCDSIFFYQRHVNKTKLECPYCDTIAGINDFSDFLYVGIENNSEFN